MVAAEAALKSLEDDSLTDPPTYSLMHICSPCLTYGTTHSLTFLQVVAAEAALKSLEDDAYEVHEAYKAAEAQCAEKEGELKEMQSKYEAFKSVVAKVRY